jgi:hypothetical protein
MLESVIVAEQRAAELRQAHGLGAEQACDALIADHRQTGPQIAHLKDVRRALRWV